MLTGINSQSGEGWKNGVQWDEEEKKTLEEREKEEEEKKKESGVEVEVKVEFLTSRFQSSHSRPRNLSSSCSSPISPALTLSANDA